MTQKERDLLVGELNAIEQATAIIHRSFIPGEIAHLSMNALGWLRSQHEARKNQLDAEEARLKQLVLESEKSNGETATALAS